MRFISLENNILSKNKDFYQKKGELFLKFICI